MVPVAPGAHLRYLAVEGRTLKNEVNPVVAAVLIGILVIGLGWWLYTGTAARSVTKSQARGDMGTAMENALQKAKGQQPAGNQ